MLQYLLHKHGWEDYSVYMVVQVKQTIHEIKETGDVDNIRFK